MNTWLFSYFLEVRLAPLARLCFSVRDPAVNDDVDVDVPRVEFDVGCKSSSTRAIALCPVESSLI